MKVNQSGQAYSSDDDSDNATISAQEMIVEDFDFSDNEEISSGRTTKNSATPSKLLSLPAVSQSRASTSTSTRSTPKTAWDEGSSKSNSPLPTPNAVVREATEYLGQNEARRRALMIEQQKALTEHMIFGARANIADMSANGAIPPSANSNPPENTSNQRRRHCRRPELTGYGITMFSTIEKAPVRHGQLAPLPSKKC